MRAGLCAAVAVALAGGVRAELPGAEARPEAVPTDVRSRRPWLIGGEAGWNALPGAGLIVGRRIDPHLTLEAGVGLSTTGPKFGLRARYGFLQSPWTPFVGVGFLYGTGVRGPESQGSGTSAFTYRIDPSPFLQLVAGAELQAPNGLFFAAAAGYAPLLRENVRILTAGARADPSSLRDRTGSGPVASVALGRAF